MIYLAANNTGCWRLRERGFPIGWMLSASGGWKNPRNRTPTMPFALDNGLFHKPGHPPKGMKALPPFYAMLRRCLNEGLSPMFVVVPDVPYDGNATRILSAKHRRHLRENGYSGPRALAVQDGMTPDDLDGYEAVFVAGSTDWKWRTARGWVRRGQGSRHVGAHRTGEYPRPDQALHRHRRGQRGWNRNLARRQGAEAGRARSTDGNTAGVSVTIAASAPTKGNP